MTDLPQALAAAAATVASIDASTDDGFREARAAIERVNAALLAQARENTATAEYQRRHGSAPSQMVDDAERGVVGVFGPAGLWIMKIEDGEATVLASFPIEPAAAEGPAAQPVRSDFDEPVEYEPEDCGTAPPARWRRRRNRPSRDESP